MTIIRPVIRDIIRPVIRSVLDPGIGVSDIATIQRLLFGDGQPGVAYIPTLSPAMITGNVLGTGVETLVDLRGLNNATQASAGSRPAWMRVPEGGRTNFFTHSENFSNADWTKTQCTYSAGVLTAINTFPRILQIAPTIPDNQTVTMMAEVKAGTAFVVRQRITSRSNTIREVHYNLSTGTKGTEDGATGSIVNLGDGWYRLITTANVNSGATPLEIRPLSNDNVATGGWTVDNTVQIRRASLNIGSTLLPYQLVTTVFDVTESGKRSIYGLRADGIDDGMVTPSIDFSGVDKVTVFAAVRKLSDAARGTIVELGPSIDSNNGSFHLTAPNAASATLGFESKGTTLRDAVISSKASPIYAVLTAEGDIAGDMARLQFNNETAVENTGDQGSGNYSNAVLNLFRRGGASLPLNGDCFALIVAGGSYDSATKNTIKAIIAKYTPTVTL